MICRRGGIDKNDIGAIRIMDTTTEFEISARAAESFAVKIRRPDKEDNIRIEALPEGPQRGSGRNRPHRASVKPPRIDRARRGRRDRTASPGRTSLGRTSLGRQASIKRDTKP